MSRSIPTAEVARSTSRRGGKRGFRAKLRRREQRVRERLRLDAARKLSFVNRDQLPAPTSTLPPPIRVEVMLETPTGTRGSAADSSAVCLHSDGLVARVLSGGRHASDTSVVYRAAVAALDAPAVAEGKSTPAAPSSGDSTAVSTLTSSSGSVAPMEAALGSAERHTSPESVPEENKDAVHKDDDDEICVPLQCDLSDGTRVALSVRVGRSVHLVPALRLAIHAVEQSRSLPPSDFTDQTFGIFVPAEDVTDPAALEALAPNYSVVTDDTFSEDDADQDVHAACALPA